MNTTTTKKQNAEMGNGRAGKKEGKKKERKATQLEPEVSRFALSQSDSQLHSRSFFYCSDPSFFCSFLLVFFFFFSIGLPANRTGAHHHLCIGDDDGRRKGGKGREMRKKMHD